jgi:hypothetical protein
MSTSIGYSSAINGSNVAYGSFAANPKNPGGAINGWMPQQTQLVDKKYVDYEQIRFTLKNAWNTKYPYQLKVNKLKQTITTPFRAINNAGDILSRENYSCGGPCQSFQSRPGLHGLKQNFGAISTTCVPSAAYNSLQLINNIPAAACNVKYVYDSSDYTRYLKQKAVNLNYNDLSYGGDQSNGSQVAWKAVRRY